MDVMRRTLLKGAGATGTLAALLAAGLLRPGRVMAAAARSGFDAKDLAGALAGIGASDAATSGDIVIKAPDIAENGAVVPVDVTSNIPGTESIAVLVENNPNPLSAEFMYGDGAMPYAHVRLKLAKTSNVKVVAKAGGKSYIAGKEIKVTVGGCGG